MASDRNRNRPPTLSDVARHAGVSPMTVSRVLNAGARVKDSTRERVMASIRALNYAPNLSARRLAGGHSARICLLYGNPSSGYLGELLVGVLEAASELGHQVIVERVNDEVAPEEFYADLEKTWDGLIAPAPISDVAEFRTLVEDETFPTVFLSSMTRRVQANEITINDYEAGREMTRFLIDQGHERIGFVKGHPTHSVSRRRYQGFQEALSDAGLSADESWIGQGYFTYRSGLEVGDRILGQRSRPTAIFAANDDMAAGVLGAAARRGLRVPDDVSVCGFDDSPIATKVWPYLTTVRQPVAEMAALAMRVIDQLLSGRKRDDDAGSSASYVPYSISVRDSVAAPRRVKGETRERR